MNKKTLNLVELHKGKTTSEHDLVWKGKALHLAINPAPKGAWNLIYWFWCHHEAVEMMPGVFMPGQDHKQPFTGIVVKQRWWHGLSGTTEDKLLERGLVKLKALTEKLKGEIERHEQIQDKFGIRKDNNQDSKGCCTVQEVPPSQDPA